MYIGVPSTPVSFIDSYSFSQNPVIYVGISHLQVL